MKSVWSLRRRWYSSATGLLDLEQQVGGGPDLVGGVQDLAARGDVLAVRDRGADAGAALDDDLVAVAHELVHAGGGDGHPELVVLDLAGDADLHVDHGPWLRGYGDITTHTRARTGTPGETAGDGAAEPV
ncbi:hypothetical protein GCM10019016_041350 [Streptomyces prasinosporus]|uniref:Uncharacterized protein n=1 Tax=Streptomyces prasinosporus TaxID=68256 RepID=A0ABP6TQJ8_9ACTN